MTAGLLTRLIAPRADVGNPSTEGYGPASDYWYQPLSAYSNSGMNVTADSAMKVSIVFECVRVLAETVGTVPLFMNRRLPNGGKERAPDHPIYGLLHDGPNADQTAIEFKEMITGHVALRGNAYCRILPGPRGPVDQLVPIHPDRVLPERLPDGSIRYKVRDPRTGGAEYLLRDEIFHLRGLSSDGLRGLSVIELARESIGLALVAESYGAHFWGQGTRPSGIINRPKEAGRLSDAALDRLKKQWTDTYGGPNNAGKVPILEEGMTWQQVGMSSEDAQFLESRQFQVEDIARWFRVPLHMLQDLKRMTFNNVEQLSIEFVIYTMMPWFVRWEERIEKDLVFNSPTYFPEFSVDSLLRGDTTARYAAYAIGRSWGWFNADEIREKENMNPLPNGLGQIYLQPANYIAVGSPKTAGTPLPPDSLAAMDRRMLLLGASLATSLVRKEIAAVSKAAKRFANDGLGWEVWVRDFYGELANEISQRCYVLSSEAETYTEEQRSKLLNGGAATVEGSEGDKIAALLPIIMKAD